MPCKTALLQFFPHPAKELFVISGVTLKFHFLGLPRQYEENRKYNKTSTTISKIKF
jgi:hypothetical protein